MNGQEGYFLGTVENRTSAELYVSDITFVVRDAQGKLYTTGEVSSSYYPDLFKPGDKVGFYSKLGGTGFGLTVQLTVQYTPTVLFLPDAARPAVQEYSGKRTTMGTYRVDGIVYNSGVASSFTKVNVQYYDQNGVLVWADYEYTTPDCVRQGASAVFQDEAPSSVAGRVAGVGFLVFGSQSSSCS